MSQTPQELAAECWKAMGFVNDRHDQLPVLTKFFARAMSESPSDLLVGSDSLKNALEMTGCKDEADLIDMANVGNSLMERIDSLVSMPGPYHHWSPADDPAEIVFDLVNDLDELRDENAKLREAIKTKVDAIYKDDHEKADALLRAALSAEVEG